MNGAGEESGAVLVVFLEFEVGLDQALQNFVAVGSQTAAWRRLVDLGCRGAQEGGEGRTGGRFEKNMGIRSAGTGSELIQFVPLDEEQVPGRMRGDHFRKILSGNVIPQQQVRDFPVGSPAYRRDG